MYSVPGDTTSLVPGFPIRTSSDHSSVDSSPRHIAASHVLHRLPVPRHPPCALKHLQTQNQFKKEIAHQKNNNHTTNPHPRKGEARQRHGCRSLDARNHYPQIKHHTPPPKTGRQQPHPHGGATPRKGRTITPGSPKHRAKRRHGLVVSKPNSVLVIPTGTHPHGRHVRRAPEPTPTTDEAHPPNPPDNRTPAICGTAPGLVVLLRKEVIQPHLPVRLPCYDFVPIADPTFDRSLPNGLGHGLRVLPTFMT